MEERKRQVTSGFTHQSCGYLRFHACTAAAASAPVAIQGTNCGLFMFKADRPADLSSGKLYAAKFTQDGAADNFKVSWILLGSGE